MKKAKRRSANENNKNMKEIDNHHDCGDSTKKIENAMARDSNAQRHEFAEYARSFALVLNVSEAKNHCFAIIR